jgi:hypothetical protein
MVFTNRRGRQKAWPQAQGDPTSCARRSVGATLAARRTQRLAQLQREPTTGLRFHDQRGTHETLVLDAGVPVHVAAARCGHDPAILLRTYARRTKKADTSAAAIIGAMSKGMID